MIRAEPWRTIAVVSTVGWIGTGWYALRADPSPSAATATAEAAAPPSPPRSRTAQRHVVVTTPQEPRTDRARRGDTGRAAGGLSVVGEPSEAAIARAREIIEQERQERHREHEEERTQDALDQLDAFAEENDLSDEQYADLSEAVVQLHEALSEMGPPGGPPGSGGDDGGPRAAFDAFNDVLQETLSEEQADALHEALRPQGPPPR